MTALKTNWTPEQISYNFVIMNLFKLNVTNSRVGAPPKDEVLIKRNGMPCIWQEGNSAMADKITSYQLNDYHTLPFTQIVMTR